MKLKIFTLWLAVAGPLFAATPPRVSPAGLDSIFQAARAYAPGASREPFGVLEQLIQSSQPGDVVRKELEQRMVRFLDSNASDEAKRLVCRQLWVMGTDGSLKALEKLLAGSNTCAMACYALRNYPGDAANAVLRTALEKAQGSALLDVINALGDRRDAKSVPALASHLARADSEAAPAIIAALGRIGTRQAFAVLEPIIAANDNPNAMPARFAAVQIAQRLMQEDKKSEATAVFKRLQQAPGSPRIERAILLGLVQLGDASARDLVAEALHGSDPLMRSTAIAQIPRLKNQDDAQSFIFELDKAEPIAQAQLVDAFAARKELAALPEIQLLSYSERPAVANAALRALGRYDSITSIPMLIAAVNRGQPVENVVAAIDSLRQLTAASVNERIAAALPDAPVAARPDLIEVLVARQATAFVPLFVQLAADPDAKVAGAALKAIGRLGTPDHMAALLQRLVANPNADTETAVIQLAQKIVGAGKQSEPVLAVYAATTSVPGRAALLRVLAETAGPKALATVVAATADPEEAIRDAAIRSLANWPEVAALKVVLSHAQSAQKTAHQVLLLRGYLRLLAIPGQRDPAQTLQNYEAAFQLANRLEERRQALSGLGESGVPGALKLIQPLLDDPAVQAEAVLACVTAAKSATEPDKELVKAVLQKAIQVATDPKVKAQARALLNQLK
ncbi:MAG: hypothetical protein WCO56_26260 [Verrucomicrobiota bacterium]